MAKIDLNAKNCKSCPTCLMASCPGCGGAVACVPGEEDSPKTEDLPFASLPEFVWGKDFVVDREITIPRRSSNEPPQFKIDHFDGYDVGVPPTGEWTVFNASGQCPCKSFEIRPIELSYIAEGSDIKCTMEFDAVCGDSQVFDVILSGKKVKLVIEDE